MQRRTVAKHQCNGIVKAVDASSNRERYNCKQKRVPQSSGLLCGTCVCLIGMGNSSRTRFLASTAASQDDAATCIGTIGCASSACLRGSGASIADWLLLACTSTAQCDASELALLGSKLKGESHGYDRWTDLLRTARVLCLCIII
jgi:hypothetical protein